MEKERRINKRLLSYWNELKEQGGNVPLEELLQPEDIDDVWENCFVINAKTGKYIHIGKNIAALNEGQSLIGNDLYTNLISLEESNILSIVKEVVKTKAPIMQESEMVNKYGVAVKYRRCLLPLAGKNGKIERVFGGMRWKTV
jgi:hypothetical protein